MGQVPTEAVGELDITSDIKCNSLEWVIKFINESEEKLHMKEQKSPSELMEIMFKVFDVSPNDTINIEKIYHLIQVDLQAKGFVLSKLESERWSHEVEHEDDEFNLYDRLSKCIYMMFHLYEHIYSFVRLRDIVNNPTTKPVENPNSLLSTICVMSKDDEDEGNNFCQVLKALLCQLQKNGWRRYKSSVMHQVIAKSKGVEFPTKAWTNVKNPVTGQPLTIEKFVYNSTPKESTYGLWKLMYARGDNTKNVINYLTNVKDTQFADIEKSRYMWSYSNGIFSSLDKGGFIPYNSKKFRDLSNTVVTAKYIPSEFRRSWLPDKTPDWYDIPTPNMQQILDYQKFDPEVSRWMYAFLGRLCFNVGEHDGWQVIPFLKGLARTGKSTIVTKVAQHFYSEDDVRTLSNNIEKKFGVASIHDAYIFTSPEIKGDICLDQCEFQSMVSGETMSIAVKNQAAKTLQWTTPGILAGNEVPNWKDNSGSIMRRIVTFEFDEQIDDSKLDTQLEHKLKHEIGAILYKSIRAYFDKVAEVGIRDVWKALPEYFHKIRAKVALLTNPLENFLSSDYVKRGSDLACPKAEFVTSFNQHCAENNLGKFKFNADFFHGPFKRHGIRIEKRDPDNERTMSVQEWVVGVDVIQDSHGHF